LNHIQIIGRVGQTPELKTSQSGNKFYTLSVVSNSKKNGEECSTWYRCTIFNYSQKFMEYVKKGSAVIINGVLQIPSIYEAKDGTSKVSLDIIVSSINFNPFSSKKEEANSDGQEVQEGQANAQAVPMDDPRDEDLPF